MSDFDVTNRNFDRRGMLGALAALTLFGGCNNSNSVEAPVSSTPIDTRENNDGSTATLAESQTVRMKDPIEFTVNQQIPEALVGGQFLAGQRIKIMGIDPTAQPMRVIYLKLSSPIDGVVMHVGLDPNGPPKEISLPYLISNERDISAPQKWEISIFGRTMDTYQNVDFWPSPISFEVNVPDHVSVPQSVITIGSESSARDVNVGEPVLIKAPVPMGDKQWLRFGDLEVDLKEGIDVVVSQNAAGSYDLTCHGQEGDYQFHKLVVN